VFLWTGNLESAEEYLDRFVSHAESHSLGPYLALGRGYRGELAIRRGDVFRDSSDGRSATPPDGRLNWPKVGLARA
jgi:hypothetical protein